MESVVDMMGERGPQHSRGHFLRGHSKPVQCCAFDPGGLQLATGSDDTTVRIWDVKTRALLRVLSGHSAGISACAYVHGSRLLVTTSWDWGVRIWDLTDQADSNSYELVHAAPVRTCAVHPRDAVIAAGDEDRWVYLWDIQARQSSEDTRPVRIFRGHGAAVRVCAFSPDGRLLATGAEDGGVQIWGAEDGTVQWRQTLPGAVLALAFNSDGGTLAGVSSDGTVVWWQVASGAMLRNEVGFLPNVESCTFSADLRRIGALAEDGTVTVWDLGSFRSHILGSHEDGGECCAWSTAEDLLATASWDGTAGIWRVP